MILEATIDPITRGISFKDELLAGETDVDVMAVRFTCPNNIGIDTNLYDMNIKVRYANARKELSTFYVVEKRKSGDNVIFDWKLNEPASRYDGTLYFNVTAEYYSGTTLTKRWNTQMYPIEVFKTLAEGDEQATVEELTEFEILLNQLSGTVTDMADLKESMEESAAAITTLTAEGDGTVTLSGISDPTAVGEWYEEYVKSAKWLVGKTAIPANADLNTYTTVGNYYAPSAAIASSLNGTPVTSSPFGLTVERILSDVNNIRQVVASAKNVVYERTSEDGGTTWKSWNIGANVDRQPNNATTFTFSAPRMRDEELNSASFAYFLLAGGSDTYYSLWFGMLDVADPPAVHHIEITSRNRYTLTFSYNESTGVLTVTSDRTVYGGLRLVWLG